MAMHRIGLLEGGTGCAGLLSRALPPGLWARCHPAQAGGVYDLLLVAPDWCGPLPAGLTCRALLWPGRLGPLTEALEAGVLLLAGIPPEKLPASRA